MPIYQIWIAPEADAAAHSGQFTIFRTKLALDAMLDAMSDDDLIRGDVLHTRRADAMDEFHVVRSFPTGLRGGAIQRIQEQTARYIDATPARSPA